MKTKTLSCKCPYCHNDVLLDTDKMSVFIKGTSVETVLATCPSCKKTITGILSYVIGAPEDEGAQFEPNPILVK